MVTDDYSIVNKSIVNNIILLQLSSYNIIVEDKDDSRNQIYRYDLQTLLPTARSQQLD